MDRDITLTRRQLLGGALTLGAASAASGAGTFAFFSDTETATGSITAGSLDLSIENTDGDVTNGDGSLSFLNAPSIEPGSTGSGAVTLKNVGSLDGYLTLRTVQLTNAENGYSEDEPEDDNGEGELADLLSVDVSMSGSNGDKTFCSGVSLASFFVPDDTYSLDYELAAGDSATFTVDWELPSEVGNEVQGDSIGLELVFGLHQEQTGQALPNCTPVDIGDGNNGEDGGEEEEDDGESTVTADADSVTVGLGDTATNSGSFDGFGDDPDVSSSAGTVTVSDGTWSWSSDDTTDLRSETVTVTVTGADGTTESVSFDVTVELAELAACGISPDDLASETRSALAAAANAGKVSTVDSGNNPSVPAGGAVFLRTPVQNVNGGGSDGVVVVCGHEIDGEAVSNNVKPDHLVLRDADVGVNLKNGKSVSVVGSSSEESSSVGKKVKLGGGVLHIAAGARLVIDKNLTVGSLVLEPNARLEVGGKTDSIGGKIEIADSATVTVTGNDNAGIETGNN